MLSKLLQEKKEQEHNQSILCDTTEVKEDKKNINIPRSFSESSFFTIKAKNIKKTEKQYIFNLEVLPINICLLYFNKSEYTKVIYMLMKEVIFQDNYNFFSLTICDDEISVFLDQHIVDKFTEKNSKFYHQPNAVDRDYRAIRVYDSIDGVSHIGIVSKISTLLAESNIPILYVNSYNNNYILVPDSELENAKKCLTDSGNICF